LARRNHSLDMHVCWGGPGSLHIENASAMGSFYEQNLAADHGREMCICCGQLGIERAPEKGIEVVLWFQRKWGMDVPVSLNPVDFDVQFSGQRSARQERHVLVTRTLRLCVLQRLDWNKPSRGRMSEGREGLVRPRWCSCANSAISANVRIRKPRAVN
jgi:hypothetical protein